MIAPAHISLQSIAAVNERCAAFLMKRSRKQHHMNGCYRAIFTKGLQAPSLALTREAKLGKPWDNANIHHPPAFIVLPVGQGQTET